MRDKDVLVAMGGFAAGAGVLFWLDPRSGARRRAEVGQQATHASRQAGEAAGKTARDLANRARGLLAALRAWRERAVDDVVLAERVRAKLGRYSSHPGAIEVACEGGRVELKGDILASEADEVLDAAACVRGVSAVDDDLRRHKTADAVPALQGGAGRPPGEIPELLQENWAPATRLLVGTAGIALVALGANRRGILRSALTGAGGMLVARALTNLDFSRLLGIGAGPRAVDLRKTLHIEAPPSEVYACFCAMEDLPRFMEHVREVRRTGDGRYLWRVAGPADVPVEWEAEVTAQVPNEVLAWKTLPGSSVMSTGIVRFTPERGGTRLDVQLSYNPPAGGVGHAVAHLLGSDPKQQMDEDLLRLKSLLEQGKATGHQGTVVKEDVHRR